MGLFDRLKPTIKVPQPVARPQFWRPGVDLEDRFKEALNDNTLILTGNRRVVEAKFEDLGPMTEGANHYRRELIIRDVRRGRLDNKPDYVEEGRRLLVGPGGALAPGGYDVLTLWDNPEIAERRWGKAYRLILPLALGFHVPQFEEAVATRDGLRVSADKRTVLVEAETTDYKWELSAQKKKGVLFTHYVLDSIKITADPAGVPKVVTDLKELRNNKSGLIRALGLGGVLFGYEEVVGKLVKGGYMTPQAPMFGNYRGIND